MTDNGTKPLAYILITLNPDHSLHVECSTKNKITAYGMLEVARETLQNQPQQHESDRIVIPELVPVPGGRG